MRSRTKSKLKGQKQRIGWEPQTWYLRSTKSLPEVGCSPGKPTPPTCAGLSRNGLGPCSSQFPQDRGRCTQERIPLPSEPPNFMARGAPPGPRLTSLGLFCGGGSGGSGGAAAGPLSPTLSPGKAAAHNCE